MPEIPELARYARAAAASIPNRRGRRDTRAELYEHAVSRYEEERAAGADHAAAVRATLERLGEPSDYAGELDRAHRARLTPFAVTVLVLATLAFFALLWAIAYTLANQL